MRRVEDLRQNARDCRALARRMPPRHREQLLEIAQHWEELARESDSAPESQANPVGWAAQETP